MSAVARLLDENSLRAVITGQEDAKLHSMGLRKSMPEGSGNLKARYIAAGIELVANRYSQLLKAGQRRGAS